MYQIDGTKFDDLPKGFYTMLKHKTKKVQYSNKGFDKMDINFVEIESLCRKCGSFFSFKLLLHKHLKKGCTGSIQPLLLTSTTLTLPIPIIESKAVIPAMGSGLAF